MVQMKMQLGYFNGQYFFIKTIEVHLRQTAAGKNAMKCLNALCVHRPAPAPVLAKTSCRAEGWLASARSFRHKPFNLIEAIQRPHANCLFMGYPVLDYITSSRERLIAVLSTSLCDLKSNSNRP